MIKGNVRVANNLTFEVTGEEQKAVFRELAEIQETFANTTCGRCGSEARFLVRVVEDNDFYEMRCTNPKCRARLHYGVNKKGGGVFPKRKTDDGKYHQFGGWMVWNKEQNKEV